MEELIEQILESDLDMCEVCEQFRVNLNEGICVECKGEHNE